MFLPGKFDLRAALIRQATSKSTTTGRINFSLTSTVWIFFFDLCFRERRLLLTIYCIDFEKKLNKLRKLLQFGVIHVITYSNLLNRHL